MVAGTKAFVNDVAGTFRDDGHSYNLKDYSYFNEVK